MTRLFAGTPFDRPPICERCGRPEAECACPSQPAVIGHLPPAEQTAKLSIERRKKGKVVTLIRGLSAEANDLPALLTQLKDGCGAGGTLDGDVLEIQGDQLARLRTLLASMGYRIHEPRTK